MEECCGKINLCKRGCRANPQTCQEYLKTLEGQEGWNKNYPHTGSHRGSNLVVKHLEREERAKSLTERSESIYYHRCIRCGRKLCLGEWQHSNREEPKCGEHRCKHQCKRTRSSPEVLGEPWRYSGRDACTLVLLYNLRTACPVPPHLLSRYLSHVTHSLPYPRKHQNHVLAYTISQC